MIVFTETLGNFVIETWQDKDSFKSQMIDRNWKMKWLVKNEELFRSVLQHVTNHGQDTVLVSW
jgi:hypothetical protein